MPTVSSILLNLDMESCLKTKVRFERRQGDYLLHRRLWQEHLNRPRHNPQIDLKTAILSTRQTPDCEPDADTLQSKTQAVAAHWVHPHATVPQFY
ncbi:hypothetical protein CA54_10690 [Symmachiella macrocystis]|uniref:Uncharacterized protein n=1 Tax=Symmachiella macrocystis TaxID=2527985 RepID=A0A5C6BLR9_9PLAN|nr:hypothetical protein CA54_10690 [Symmachiella macrocystis]